jgi:hypothetical protein
MPNTTPVLPESTVDVEAQVLAAILVPSESPEVRAMVQSEPSAVSKSNLLVQVGLVGVPTKSAAKVVTSCP